MDEQHHPKSSREKGMVLMRSIMDYGMGLLWMSMGIFLIFTEYINPAMAYQFSDPAMKVFGGVCIIYGLFRMYRGYKKNYFRER